MSIISFHLHKKGGFAYFQNFLVLPIISLENIMVLISEIQAIRGDPGETGKALTCDELIGGLTENEKNILPKCETCGFPLPPRAFHCDECHKCHLKMCFHSTFLGVCIAIKNERPYIVMFYWIRALIATYLVFILSGFMIDLSKIVILIFGLCYFAFFVVIHDYVGELVSNVSKNRTFMEIQTNTGYNNNIGRRKNIEQVFGKGVFRFYIPIRSSKIGFEWIDEDVINDK